MALPLSRQRVLLNDGSTATIIPVWDATQLPLELVASLCNEYNAEIDRGCSFPETQRMLLETFEKKWFSGVSGVVISGNLDDIDDDEDLDLLDNYNCLGSFCLSPCFAGRSAHICSANFLVKHKFRRQGVGKAMTQCFMRWALHLGYHQALFQLVYDCNIAACHILTKLDFKILGVLKGAGILKGFDHPVDAFIFGRHLVATPTTPAPVLSSSLNTPAAVSSPGMSSTPGINTPNELDLSNMMSLSGSSFHHDVPKNDLEHNPKITEEVPHSTMSDAHCYIDNPLVEIDQNGIMREDRYDRTLHRWPVNETRKHTREFNNIRNYLMTSTYPPNITRVERTRIRSRSRSYYMENGVLMCKRTCKPVVSDPNEQFFIADLLHQQNHNGINKLQKLVLERYFWQGVRETITRVIKACAVCKSGGHIKPSVSKSLHQAVKRTENHSASSQHRSSQQLESAALHSRPMSGTQEIQWYTNILSEPQDPGSVVYLRPENEDEEYIPDDSDYDMGLGGAENEDFLEEDDDLFRDDEEWSPDDGEDDDNEVQDDNEDQIDNENQDHNENLNNVDRERMLKNF